MFSPQTRLFSYQHTLLRTLWKQHIPFVVNYALFSTSPDDLHLASHIRALMNWPITWPILKSKTVHKRGTKLELFN